MTPDIIRKLTVAAAAPTINGRTADVIRRVRAVLARANVDPVEAVMRLARDRANTHLRPEFKCLNRPDLRAYLDNYEPDPRENSWAVEAIMRTLAKMDENPTPAQLGELGRHFLIAPPRAKWPALSSEFVAAIHRMRRRGRISETKIEAILDFGESLTASIT